VNRVKNALANGDVTFGAIVTIPSAAVVQILAAAGLDWVIIDLEHGPIDTAAAHAMIAATGGTELVPFVRLPWSDGWMAKRPLDLGARGVCFPMVNDAATATAAVRSLRYPPEGDRLWGPFYAHLARGLSIPDYLQQANDDVVAIATIEHPDAVANIDEIAAVPGLDLAFIGPGDLATSLGIPGQLDHPDFTAAVAAAERGLLASSVSLGGVARTADQAKQMIDRGYRALVLGFDWSLLLGAASGLLAQIEAVRG